MTENSLSKRIGYKESGKRVVEYIAVCHNYTAYQAVLKSSPDSVIKYICNAVINAFKGDIVITKSQRKFLKQYRQSVHILVDPIKGLNKKRKIIISKNSYSFIPKILSIVLNQLGSALFNL